MRGFASQKVVIPVSSQPGSGWALVVAKARPGTVIFSVAASSMFSFSFPSSARAPSFCLRGHLAFPGLPAFLTSGPQWCQPPPWPRASGVGARVRSWVPWGCFWSTDTIRVVWGWQVAWAPEQPHGATLMEQGFQAWALCSDLIEGQTGCKGEELGWKF